MLIGHAHWNTVATSRTTQRRHRGRRAARPAARPAPRPPDKRRRRRTSTREPTTADATRSARRTARSSTPMRMLLTTNARARRRRSSRPPPTHRPRRPRRERREPQRTGERPAAHRTPPAASAEGYRRASERRPGNLPDRPGDLLDRSGTFLCSPGLARRIVSCYQPTLEGTHHDDASGTTGRRIGLVILGLVSLGDMATLALTDGETPPYAVAAVVGSARARLARARRPGLPRPEQTASPPDRPPRPLRGHRAARLLRLRRAGWRTAAAAGVVVLHRRGRPARRAQVARWRWRDDRTLAPSARRSIPWPPGAWPCCFRSDPRRSPYSG